MAEEKLKALVRKFSPMLDVHPATWETTVGCTGHVWVEDDGRGLWLVRVLKSPAQEAAEPQGTLIRPATADDLAAHEARAEEARGLLGRAQDKVDELDLPMRFTGAELDLTRRFLRLFFSAPGRVDFRDLLRDLGAEFKLRIEFRQIGPRDEARLLGTVGPCGRPLCCRTFLRKLRPIPLEIAFEQQLFLSPERITGACGRLMCCLAYEHEQYLEALQGLPKLGDEVVVDGRTGQIVGFNMFRSTVTVQWGDGTKGEVHWEKLRHKPPRKGGGKSECPPLDGTPDTA